MHQPLHEADGVGESPRLGGPSKTEAPRTSSAVVSFAASPRRHIPPWSRRFGILMICCYVVWAFVIPAKNVLMIKTPTLRVDTIVTETVSHLFDTATDSSTVREISGQDIVVVLRQVVEIVVGTRPIREQLEALGTFDIDTIHAFLGPNEFQVMSLYYSLITQASDFPGGVFTPRARHFTATSAELPLDAIGVWVVPSNGSDAWLLTLSCPEERAFMDGTKCFQNATDDVCYDFPMVGDRRTYGSVSLQSSRTNAGLGNNVELLHLLETFHATMAMLFSTKSWNKTLDGMQFLTSQDQEQKALDNGFSSVFRDGIPTILEKSAMASFSLRLEDLSSSTLESCFLSEIFTLSFYTNAFVLSLIEDTLIGLDGQQYGADPDHRLRIPHDRVSSVVAYPLTQKVLISSGARPNSAVALARTKIFTGLTLTTITNATARLKFDQKLDSVEAMGSNLRMLLMMAMYPEYYSYYSHSVVSDPKKLRGYDTMAFSLLGGAMSGLNTFKRNWWGNTMGVFKLAELVRDAEDARLDTWWDDGAKSAAWFQRLEATSDAPFYALANHIDISATGIVLDDDPVTRCHRAFYKTLVKIMWLSLLTASAQPSYLVFMSNFNGGARPWFVNMIKRFELVGETTNGARYSFPYSSTSTNRKDDGSAWVVVPLLHAMLEYFGRSGTIDMILTEYNASFPLFVTTEYGLVHFTDSAQCRIGFRTNNVSAETNTMDKITTAFYPSIEKFVKQAVDDHAALYAAMETALAVEGMAMVHIPKELLMGSPSAPNTIGFVGSPVFWRPTAVTAGILLLWPATVPPPAVVQSYRDASICYRTLELRYLNESIRCWVEPGSVARNRVAYDSEGLRYLIWSNWSIGWVLNSIAFVIAAHFCRRFVVAYRRTRFQCVSFCVAAQFNFQSVGVLSYGQVLLMTMSSVPLLIAYHLPTDETFMEDSEKTLYPKFVRDCIVTLSATWFIRLGFDTANQLVAIREVYTGINAFRLRLIALIVVFIGRLISPDKLDDANYEMSKLLVTCSISILFGVLCAAVPVALHRRAGKITPTSPIRARSLRSPTSLQSMSLLSKSQNIVIKQLQEEGMPLNHHGLLGFSRLYGWSLTGLIVEGWKVTDRKAKNQVVVTKDRCKIRLQINEQGELTQCLL